VCNQNPFVDDDVLVLLLLLLQVQELGMVVVLVLLARSKDEPSQVFTANCDQSPALSNSFCERLFIRVSLRSDFQCPDYAECP
jgi:hypothetical protein